MIVQCVECRRHREIVDQSGSPPRPPIPGDFWLCPSCGFLHRFVVISRVAFGAETITVLRPVAAGLEQLEELEPEQRARLLEHRRRILERPEARAL